MGYLPLCNLNPKFNVSFDRSLWGCCQYLVAGLILPWVEGISRTVDFGGLRLVFFWAYLYCSLVGWNMGVDPLEWGGATLLGRRTLLELSRWEIITKYFPYSIQPSLVKLDNLKNIFYGIFPLKFLR